MVPRTIRWVPVVEEIENSQNPDPFSIESNAQGIVALRINYPVQSASMSSFQSDFANQFDPTVGSPNAANDGGVVELNDSQRPGDLIGQPSVGGGIYASTYGGTYGLGAQGALGQTVRPYRRVIFRASHLSSRSFPVTLGELTLQTSHGCNARWTGRFDWNRG